MKMPKTPELEKIKTSKEETQWLGEFINWCSSRGWTFCSLNKFNDNYYPIGMSIRNLLALYKEVDLVKVEKERQKLLDYIRRKK